MILSFPPLPEVRMKRLAAILALLAVAALAAFAPPKPKAAISQIDATDSTVTYAAVVSVKNSLQPGDVLRYNWFQNGTLTKALDTTAPSMSQDFKAPCGTTGQVYLVVRVVYANGTMTPTVKSNVASYTQAACPIPPATIDSVRISPASLNLTPGQTVTVKAAIYQ